VTDKHQKKTFPDAAASAPALVPGTAVAGRSALAKDLLTMAAIAIVYFVAGKLGLKLAYVHPSATAVWPPTGFTLAVFLLLGYRVWPGIFLGALLVNLTTAGSLPVCLGVAAGNTAEGLLGCYLLNKFAGGKRAFDSPQGITAFVFLAATFCWFVSDRIYRFLAVPVEHALADFANDGEHFGEDVVEGLAVGQALLQPSGAGLQGRIVQLLDFGLERVDRFDRRVQRLDKTVVGGPEDPLGKRREHIQKPSKFPAGWWARDRSPPVHCQRGRKSRKSHRFRRIHACFSQGFSL